VSTLQDKYGIYDIDVDGAFPTPQKYVAARAVTPDTDFEALGKSYSAAYQQYAKASGLPEWQQTAYAEDIAAEFFSGIANKEAFDANYALKTGAAPAKPQQPAELPYAGQGHSFVQGAGGAVGGSISGIGDLSNALATKTTDPSSAWDYFAPDFMANTVVLPEGDAGFQLPKIYTPEQISSLRLLDPDKYGKSGETMFHAVGDPIKAATAIPEGTQPNLVGSSIGSASGTLLTAAGAGLAGLGRAAATGMAVTQSAAQLANEGATDYRRTMAAQGKVVDEKALADTTLLNASLASLDALHVGGVARQAAGGIEKTLTHIGKSATWEAGTEAAQTAGQNIIASNIVGYDPTRSTLQNTDEAAAGGGIAGTFMAAILPGRGGATTDANPNAPPTPASTATQDTEQPQPPSTDPFDTARKATQQAKADAASSDADQAARDVATLNALMARTPAIRTGAATQDKLESEIVALQEQQATDQQLGLGETQQAKDAAKAIVAKQKELAKLGNQRAALQQMEGLQTEIAGRTKGSGLSALISSGEGGYGSFNRGVAGDANGVQIDFSQMTVAELQRRQRLPVGDPNRILAFGKYQIIPTTMFGDKVDGKGGAFAALGIDPNERVTPELQERIYQQYLTRAKQPKMRDFIEGKHSDLHAAQDALAGEWASIADPDTGRSHYGDRGGNKASVTAGQSAQALLAARKMYADSLSKGMSPEQAWAFAVGGVGQSQLALPRTALAHPDDVYLVNGRGDARVRSQADVLGMNPVAVPSSSQSALGTPTLSTLPPAAPPAVDNPPELAQQTPETAEAAPEPAKLPDAFAGAKPLTPYEDVPIPVDAYIGQQVAYGSVTGKLTKTDTGVFVGDTLVESGLSGRSAQELGIKKISAATPDIAAARNQAAAEKAASTPITDWSQNLISLRGKQYTYVTATSDENGVTQSITARDAAGKEVTFRNPEVVAGIESHKIAYELEQAHDARKQWESIHAIESDPAIRAGVTESGSYAAGDSAQTQSRSDPFVPAPKLYAIGGKLRARQPTQQQTNAALRALKDGRQLSKRQQQIVDAVTQPERKPPTAAQLAPPTLDAHITDTAIQQDVPNESSDLQKTTTNIPDSQQEVVQQPESAQGELATNAAGNAQAGNVDGKTNAVDAAAQPQPAETNTAELRDAGSAQSSLKEAEDGQLTKEPITPTSSAIDMAVWEAEPPLSHLSESAVYEVFGGGKPKTAAAIQTSLRDFFRDSYDGKGSETAFIAKHMGELRRSGVLKTLTDAYIADATVGHRLNLSSTSETAIPQAKAEGAVQRILGDTPFEPMPADAPTIEGKRVLGMVRGGKIYIDTANMQSIAEAEAVAIEELSHLGIQNLFGKQYNERTKALFDAIGGRAGIEKFLQRTVVKLDSTYRTMDDLTLMDEVIAHLAAHQPSLPVRVKRALQRVIGFVRNQIRKLNTRALHNVTDSDLMYIAARARKAGKAGKAARDKPPVVDTTPIRLHIRDEQQSSEEALDAELAARWRNRQHGADLNKIRSGMTRNGINTTFNNALQNIGFRFADAKKWFNNNLRTDHGMAQALAVVHGVDIGWVSRAKPKELRDLLFGNAEARQVKQDARELTDIKRKLTWDKSATHLFTEDNLAKMAWWIKSEYGKQPKELSKDEMEAINERIRTATPADPIAYKYRSDIDTASTAIISRLHMEMAVRINELNEAGREAFDDRYDDIYDPEVNIDELPPALHRIAALKRQTDMIKANMGSYMRRSYQAFSDPKWAAHVKTTPTYTAAIEATMRNNEGMSKSQATTSINKLLDAVTGGVYDGAMSFAATGAKDHSILRKRSLNDQPEIRELLGEIKDPMFNYANTITSMSEFVASHIYQTNLRSAGLNLGLFKLEADGDFVTEFPSNKAWSALAGVYMTRDTMDVLDSMDPLGAPEYRRLIALTSTVKKWKTIYSPTTAMRNLWSGDLLLLQAGHTPFGKMGEVFDVLKNGTTHLGFSVIDPLNGGIRLSTPQARTVLAELAELGIIHNGAKSEALVAVMEDAHNMRDKLKGESWVARHIEARAVAFYRFGDDFYKMIHFFKEMDDLIKAGMPPAMAKAEAAKRTVDTMPSYDRIPRGIQMLRRFPLAGTFVSFPWEVMRTTKNAVDYALRDKASAAEAKARGDTKAASQYSKMAAKKMLGLALAQGGVVGTLTMAMNAILAGVDDDDDKMVDAMSAGWAKNTTRLYTANEDGKVTFTNLSAVVPSDYLWKAARAGWNKGNTDGIWAGVFGASKELLTPFVSEDLTYSTYREIVDNRRSDDGIPIYGKGKKFEDIFNDPEVTARAFSHAFFKLAPGAVNNLRDIAVANSTNQGEDAAWYNWIAESRGGKVAASGKTFDNVDAALALLGFRTTTLDIDILTEKASTQAKAGLTYAKSDLRFKMDQATAMSEESVKDAADRYLNERKKALRPALLAIQYHRGEGKSVSEIADLLHADSGVTLTEDEIKALMQGRMPDAALKQDDFANMTKRAFRAIDNSDDPQKFRTKQAVTARLQRMQQYLKQQR